jgi:hypothetical protein
MIQKILDWLTNVRLTTHRPTPIIIEFYWLEYSKEYHAKRVNQDGRTLNLMTHGFDSVSDLLSVLRETYGTNITAEIRYKKSLRSKFIYKIEIVKL